MVAATPPADEVLAKLDIWLTRRGHDCWWLTTRPPKPDPVRLPAVLPSLAVTDLLDTVRLSRVIYPACNPMVGRAQGSPQDPAATWSPPRAARYPATAQIFLRLIEEGAQAGLWGTLRQIRKTGGYKAKAAMPRQEALFD